MANIAPALNTDFFSLKNNLIDFLKQQDQFKDYDFAGSNLNALIDVLAYNTYHNNFFGNMAISEMFLDSAQLKESVVSHAKHLNYLPKSKTSARSLLNITINANDNPSLITIPKNTVFTARYGTKSYFFSTNETVEVIKSFGKYKFIELPVYEGRIIREFYNVDTINSKFVLSNKDIDISSIKVYVKPTINSNQEEYYFKSNIFDVTRNQQVFYIQPAFDNQYEITFGSNVFGFQPTIGSIIEIEYRITSGEEANGANIFSTSSINGYPIIVNSATIASGGSDEETIDSIKFFAPKSIQVQERAVTEFDYEILLKINFRKLMQLVVLEEIKLIHHNMVKL